jgi:hypothetical protein
MIHRLVDAQKVMECGSSANHQGLLMVANLGSRGENTETALCDSEYAFDDVA